MNYSEAIDFLFDALPMYQRVGKAAYKANLENTLRLDSYFGSPHRQFQTIHVAGTNGKGSVSHMLASVFQQAGYKTGLYTSPHLLCFRERIRINGVPVEEKEVVDFITRHQQIIKEISPSFFEMTVAMAFDYFCRQQVKIAVIETGMGGRLDSTNIISPELSIITNISYDHTEFLGKDLVSIAGEKGGIIKEKTPLVLGRMPAEAEKELCSMAQKKKSTVALAFQSFEPAFHTQTVEGTTLMRFKSAKCSVPSAQNKEDMVTVRCDLSGDYQKENVSTALCAIQLMRHKGWELTDQNINEGFASVVRNTGIMGRWQLLSNNPRSICDTAHNQAGIAAVMTQINQVPWKELHMVWGMVSDKEVDSIFPILPKSAHYYFTPSSVPRTMDVRKLQTAASAYGLKGEKYSSVKEAYQAATTEAGPDDMIFTGGSTFVVADLLKALGY